MTFTPPAFNGGSAITGYTVTSNPSGITASGAASPITVTGLTNGTAYTFTVTATNAVGTGAASAASNSVTPATVPGAPTIGTATAGNAQATVTFTPPASDGGSAITSYTATCGAFSASGPGSPITVTGLTNGTTYNCSVAATNTEGTGPASGTASVTLGLRSFSGPSATGTGTITASFTGGGAACGYAAAQLIGSPPGATPIPPTLPAQGVVFPHGMFAFTASGCTAASTLTFTIAYPTSVAGATYWKYGPTAADPAPHWYVLPATLAGNTATFTITDGGLGDDDLAANGTIVDQGGPGESTTIPTLSEWAMLMLMLLLGLTGAYQVNQRVRY